MLTFLRILTEALETEKDRINKRKLSGDEIPFCPIHREDLIEIR